jgi:hypothetical protein
MRRRFGLQGGEQPQITAWTADGHLEVPVPPGSWNVEAWTSPRHSRYVQSGVEVIAGETAQVAAEFEEVVPKAGWLSMDSHLHAAPSADGKLPMEDRVIACAAAGVDLPVNTDHDRHADYQPIVAELIRDGQLRWVAGVEVSPVLRGHFNLFPIEPAGRAVPNGGAVAWWERVEDTDELFARMRAVPGPGVSPLVQVNHGRTGMFSFSSYDWTSGAPGRENFFSWDFDAFELVNGQSNGSWEPLRRDWFSFLAVGQKKLPTGVSDSHNRGAECGFARTDIFFGEDDPDAIDPATLRAALTAGHAVVAGGITLRASLDDGTDGPPKLPGDTASADTVTISAQVLGPDWIVPAVVRLYANGELSEELPVGAWDAGTWWGGSWELSPEADTFYVVEVEGNQGIGGPWGGTVAYAATNAFFVDVDGDGWEPPGL